MITVQILVAIVIGLAVSEFSEICPWLARKLVPAVKPLTPHNECRSAAA